MRHEAGEDLELVADGHLAHGLALQGGFVPTKLEAYTRFFSTWHSKKQLARLIGRHSRLPINLSLRFVF